jgi:type IV pilus assembly protein PilN
MRIPINLASQPFRRDRPMLLASAVVSAALLLTLALLGYLALLDRAQLRSLRSDVSRLEGRLRAVRAEQARMDAVLRQPENASVLERSVFLNDLIFHKAISWSHMFADLERTAPYNVRITALHPTINSRNQVMLDMTAASDQPEGIEDLLKALEASPTFGYVYQHSTLPPTQAEPQYRSRITVPYDQKL